MSWWASELMILWTREWVSQIVSLWKYEGVSELEMSELEIERENMNELVHKRVIELMRESVSDAGSK